MATNKDATYGKEYQIPIETTNSVLPGSYYTFKVSDTSGYSHGTWDMGTINPLPSNPTSPGIPIPNAAYPQQYPTPTVYPGMITEEDFRQIHQRIDDLFLLVEELMSEIILIRTYTKAKDDDK